MRSITIIALVLLLSVFKYANAQDFGSCVPGYVSITVGDNTPGNPRQTFTNVPNICTSSSNVSQLGLLPIGQTVRLNPPVHTGSSGSRPGRIFGYMWSWYPDNPNVELRYQIRFTPDLNMYLDTAALLPNEFEVVNDTSIMLENSNLDMLYTLAMYGVK